VDGNSGMIGEVVGRRAWMQHMIAICTMNDVHLMTVLRQRICEAM